MEFLEGKHHEKTLRLNRDLFSGTMNTVNHHSNEAYEKLQSQTNEYKEFLELRKRIDELEQEVGSLRGELRILNVKFRTAGLYGNAYEDVIQKIVLRVLDNQCYWKMVRFDPKVRPNGITEFDTAAYNSKEHTLSPPLVMRQRPQHSKAFQNFEDNDCKKEWLDKSPAKYVPLTEIKNETRRSKDEDENCDPRADDLMVQSSSKINCTASLAKSTQLTSPLPNRVYSGGMEDTSRNQSSKATSSAYNVTGSKRGAKEFGETFHTLDVKKMKQPTLFDLLSKPAGSPAKVDLSKLAGYTGGERLVKNTIIFKTPPPKPDRLRHWSADSVYLAQDESDWNDVETMFADPDFINDQDLSAASQHMEGPEIYPPTPPAPKRLSFSSRQRQGEEEPCTIDLVTDYDKIPDLQPKEPAFAYKPEHAIRKKAERRRLPGWDCPECRAYYEGIASQFEPAELQRLKNKCSKHRSRLPEPEFLGNTPQYYWDTGFPSTQECLSKGLLRVGTRSPARPKRPPR